LEQLRQQGGLHCSLTTIWRALRRARLTRKKKDLHADERDRPDVQTKRRSFRRKVRRIEPKRLVFVDETGVTTAMTSAYGWAPRGQRVTGSAPASWETFWGTSRLYVLGLAFALLGRASFWFTGGWGLKRHGMQTKCVKHSKSPIPVGCVKPAL
jgi:hypothetical protein